MSILVWAESHGSRCKKAAFEAVSYGSEVAKLMNTRCIGLTIGNPENAPELGVYGADSIINIGKEEIQFASSRFAKIICAAANLNNAGIIILSHTSSGKAVAGRIAIRYQAALLSAATSLPEIQGDAFLVNRLVYSGKAVGTYNLLTEKKVISVQGNSVPIQSGGSPGEVENVDIEIPEMPYTVKGVEKQDGAIPLPEAELVVSGGRGLKGPENWGLIEELAKTIGAATACSRPVADSGWRPHHEHVGQTGVAIRPNLYLAVGISGAIQHLGGVNNSKTIVVINKDPEAPFFKAAEYGVVGDLFDVVPALIEALKKFKSETN